MTSFKKPTDFLQVEILRNAIEYIESLEEMLHGQGKLNKNMTPGALAAGGANPGVPQPVNLPLVSGPETTVASDYMVWFFWRVVVFCDTVKSGFSGTFSE